MDNLKLPAYPVTVQMENGVIGGSHQNGHTTVQMYGFTKLEYTALMIAQGYLANSRLLMKDEKISAEQFVSLAKAVLEEANK